MRICKNCNQEKEINEFPLKMNGSIKISYCKVCYSEKRKDSYKKNKEQILESMKVYYKENKEEINKRRRESYKLNKEKHSMKRKENYEKNKEYIKEKSRDYYNENKDKINDKRKNDKRSLEYYYKNKEDVNSKAYQRMKEKRKNDPLFKLTHNIRTLIRLSLVNQFTTKSKKTIEILGCTFEEFKLHLESQFDDKMNWQNQGTYWHMDHIIPISSAETEEDVYRLNHYTNFQPLYWEDNLKKSNKI
jgi:hypothetical protein